MCVECAPGFSNTVSRSLTKSAKLHYLLVEHILKHVLSLVPDFRLMFAHKFQSLTTKSESKEKKKSSLIHLHLLFFVCVPSKHRNEEASACVQRHLHSFSPLQFSRQKVWHLSRAPNFLHFLIHSSTVLQFYTLHYTRRPHA